MVRRNIIWECLVYMKDRKKRWHFCLDFQNLKQKNPTSLSLLESLGTGIVCLICKTENKQAEYKLIEHM